MMNVYLFLAGMTVNAMAWMLVAVAAAAVKNSPVRWPLTIMAAALCVFSLCVVFGGIYQLSNVGSYRGANFL